MNVKNERLKYLSEKVSNCTFCPLHKSKQYPAFGMGNLNSSIVVVGDAPRFEDTYSEKPMTGDELFLLEDLAAKSNMNINKWYITTAVKCNTPDERTPKPDEILKCRPYLLKQLGIIKPKVIVALGKVAIHSLFGEKLEISDLRRKEIDFEFFNAKVFPTYHPKYYVHQPNKKDIGFNDFYRLKKLIRRECF